MNQRGWLARLGVPVLYFFTLGVYAIRPEFPAVGGGEGVGVVTKVGSDVTSFKEGDWVVPATTAVGKGWEGKGRGR